MGILIRILILAAIVWLAWQLLRRYVLPPPRQDEPPRFEPTARCARCGTHVPAGSLDPAGRCRSCAGQP